MGYEKLRTIEFNKSKDTPIGLAKGAVLLRDGKEKVLQLKLCNNGKEILKQATVQIACLGNEGQVLGKQTYTYSQLFVPAGEEFGTDIPIPLDFQETENVEVEVEQTYKTLAVNHKTGKAVGTKIDYFPIVYDIYLMIFNMAVLLNLINNENWLWGISYYVGFWASPWIHIFLMRYKIERTRLILFDGINLILYLVSFWNTLLLPWCPDSLTRFLVFFGMIAMAVLVMIKKVPLRWIIVTVCIMLSYIPRSAWLWQIDGLGHVAYNGIMNLQEEIQRDYYWSDRLNEENLVVIEKIYGRLQTYDKIFLIVFVVGFIIWIIQRIKAYRRK